MHPPPFHLDHCLSDWPECRIEARCPGCGKSAFIPVTMLKADHGDRSFKSVLGALKCAPCEKTAAPVYLLAGQHREHCYGGPADWSIELVPKPG